MSIGLLTRFYDLREIQVGPEYISISPGGNIIGKIFLQTKNKNPFSKNKDNLIVVKEYKIEFPYELEKFFDYLGTSANDYKQFFYELYLAEWIKANDPKPKINPLVINFEFPNNSYD